MSATNMTASGSEDVLQVAALSGFLEHREIVVNVTSPLLFVVCILRK